MTSDIKLLWERLQREGWYISQRTGVYFMHTPDNRIPYRAPDRATLLNKLTEQFV